MRKLTFNERIEKRAAARGAAMVKGPFIDMILPILIQFLQGCLKPKPEPTPQPVTSRASAEAWKTADEAKQFALNKIRTGDPAAEDVQYKKTVSNAAAREVMKKQRKKGDKITRPEADAICLGFLDQARLGDLEENAIKIDQNRD